MSRINRLALLIATIATLLLLYFALLAPVPATFRRDASEGASELVQLARHVPPSETPEAEEEAVPETEHEEEDPALSEAPLEPAVAGQPSEEAALESLETEAASASEVARSEEESDAAGKETAERSKPIRDPSEPPVEAETVSEASLEVQPHAEGSESSREAEDPAEHDEVAESEGDPASETAQVEREVAQPPRRVVASEPPAAGAATSPRAVDGPRVPRAPARAIARDERAAESTPPPRASRIDLNLGEAIEQLSGLLDDGEEEEEGPPTGKSQQPANRSQEEDSLAALAAIFPDDSPKSRATPAGPPGAGVAPRPVNAANNDFERTLASLEEVVDRAEERPVPSEPRERDREGVTSATSVTREASDASPPPIDTEALARLPQTSDALDRQHEELQRLSREIDREHAATLFRLERQDPDVLRRVARQYRMDILVTSRVDGHRSVVRLTRDGTAPAEEVSAATLQSRYALSLRGVRAPWLERLRDEYVATRLISRDSVEVMLLIPRRESQVILGRIRADTARLGHALDELTACWGTFVELPARGASPTHDYRVTRLVLADGGEKRTTHWRPSDGA